VEENHHQAFVYRCSLLSSFYISIDRYLDQQQINERTLTLCESKIFLSNLKKTGFFIITQI